MLPPSASGRPFGPVPVTGRTPRTPQDNQTRPGEAQGAAHAPSQLGGGRPRFAGLLSLVPPPVAQHWKMKHTRRRAATVRAFLHRSTLRPKFKPQARSHPRSTAPPTPGTGGWAAPAPCYGASPSLQAAACSSPLPRPRRLLPGRPPASALTAFPTRQASAGLPPRLHHQALHELSPAVSYRKGSSEAEEGSCPCPSSLP